MGVDWADLLKVFDDLFVCVEDEVLGSQHDAVYDRDMDGWWWWWWEIWHVWWVAVLVGVAVNEGQEFLLFEEALCCYVELHGKWYDWGCEDEV